MNNESLTAAQKRKQDLSTRGYDQTTITIHQNAHQRLKKFTEQAGFSSKGQALDFLINHCISSLGGYSDSTSKLVNQQVNRFSAVEDRSSLLSLMSVEEKAEFLSLMSDMMNQNLSKQMAELGVA